MFSGVARICFSQRANRTELTWSCSLAAVFSWPRPIYARRLVVAVGASCPLIWFPIILKKVGNTLFHEVPALSSSPGRASQVDTACAREQHASKGRARESSEHVGATRIWFDDGWMRKKMRPAWLAPQTGHPWQEWACSTSSLSTPEILRSHGTQSDSLKFRAHKTQRNPEIQNFRKSNIYKDVELPFKVRHLGEQKEVPAGAPRW